MKRRRYADGIVLASRISTLPNYDDDMIDEEDNNEDHGGRYKPTKKGGGGSKIQVVINSPLRGSLWKKFKNPRDENQAYQDHRSEKRLNLHGLREQEADQEKKGSGE